LEGVSTCALEKRQGVIEEYDRHGKGSKCYCTPEAPKERRGEAVFLLSAAISAHGKANYRCKNNAHSAEYSIGQQCGGIGINKRSQGLGAVLYRGYDNGQKGACHHCAEEQHCRCGSKKLMFAADAVTEDGNANELPYYRKDGHKIIDYMGQYGACKLHVCGKVLQKHIKSCGIKNIQKKNAGVGNKHDRGISFCRF